MKNQVATLLTTGAILLNSACSGETPDQQPADSAESALLYANDAFALYQPGNWDPARDSYNPAGDTVVHQIGGGVYIVVFYGMQSTLNNAQITAVGDDNVRCNLLQTYSVSTAHVLRVVCRDPGGALRPSGFAAYLTQATNSPFSFGRAFITTESSEEHTPRNGYTSETGYVDNATLHHLAFEKWGVGKYTVVHWGVPPGADQGNFQLTTLGLGNVSCKLGEISQSGDILSTKVYCHDIATNAPAESKFSLLYTKDSSLHEDRGAYARVDGAPSISSSCAQTSNFFDFTPNDENCSRPQTRPDARYHSDDVCSIDFYNQVHRSGASVALVSAVGDSSTAEYCKLARRPDVPGWVNVSCFNSQGRIRTPFMIATDQADTSCPPANVPPPVPSVPPACAPPNMPAGP